MEVSLSEELREILIATSDGKLVHDRQPLVRFSVRAIAEEGGKRQTGSSGGGGRIGLEYFDDKTPEEHAANAVRHAIAMLDARESPAGELPVVLANLKGDVTETTAAAQLPNAFGGRDLKP